MLNFAFTTLRKPTIVYSLCVIAFAITASAQQGSADTHRSEANNGAVQTQMHNVMYHYADNVVVHLRDVIGSLVPTKPGQMPIFDDKKSFTLQITAAEIAIDPQSLANVLNANVFSGKDSPLKDLAISIEKGKLKIKGKLHKKGDITFETEGQLSATPDGKIRLHSEKIKAAHLPVKGLMDLIGLDIADLIKSGKVHGVQAEKDDLILDPGEILPLPRITGHISSIRLEPNNIVQVFGDLKKQKWEKVSARNYMAYHGNRLQFGKLIMTDTDMVIIDPDPRDSFDFFLDHYKEQLVAGYTKTTPEFGLRVYMVDFNKLKRKPAAATKPK
ncbi:MAG TPA: hypothetical protein VFP71_08120 [Candidatus Angelobacter sp.]|nr:hypothetical protein [Candidatus Angelobacter sp.]